MTCMMLLRREKPSSSDSHFVSSTHSSPILGILSTCDFSSTTATPSAEGIHDGGMRILWTKRHIPPSPFTQFCFIKGSILRSLRKGPAARTLTQL
ncbi:hypothetical protein EYF80_033062 [Liparis tanakae]|uniref:Uncharacterized protein n=1 Tax=Liparis tanakae TaxID=230148 RepID=A0A4Z2GSZ0_9TELE|nr:hypothetical protein EYF80_033062 [Liparis tanakae]